MICPVLDFRMARWRHTSSFVCLITTAKHTDAFKFHRTILNTIFSIFFLQESRFIPGHYFAAKNTGFFLGLDSLPTYTDVFFL